MRFALWISIALIIASCSSAKLIKRNLQKVETDFQDNIGFSLYDPTSQKTLVDYNASHYFTPASNVKILTFYTSLKLLGDSTTAIKYIQRHDSLIFWGNGDPSFLYKEVYTNNRLLEFLSSSTSKLFYSDNNFYSESFGPGWAWDDFPYYYSAERSSFPIYGNLITLHKKSADQFEIHPTYFSEHFISTNKIQNDDEVIRDVDSNELVYHPGTNQREKTWKIPFRNSSDLVLDLLSDTLKRQVNGIDTPLPKQAHAFKSVPLDSLYKVMMHESDNFIAEQLLLQCSGFLSDTLRPEITIRYSIKNLLMDLPDKPQWVDGSGLSRYNLFTPRSITKLWEKIYKQVPQEKLFPLLATGGKYGTLKNWYKSNTPYVYGKTGSLSNNAALSGYIITKKGRTLIFSFMNNNFVRSSVDVRKAMEKIINTIHKKY